MCVGGVPGLPFVFCWAGLGGDALLWIEFTDAVIEQAVLFRASVALTLLGDHMEKLGPLKLTNVAEGCD